jgi:hypothetical protein
LAANTVAWVLHATTTRPRRQASAEFQYDFVISLNSGHVDGETSEIAILVCALARRILRLPRGDRLPKRQTVTDDKLKPIFGEFLSMHFVVVECDVSSYEESVCLEGFPNCLSQAILRAELAIAELVSSGPGLHNFVVKSLLPAVPS